MTTGSTNRAPPWTMRCPTAADVVERGAGVVERALHRVGSPGSVVCDHVTASSSPTIASLVDVDPALTTSIDERVSFEVFI